VIDDEWPEFLNVAEAAGILRVSKGTIYRLVNSGEVESTRVGRSFRIYADSLRQLIKAGGI